MLVKDLADHAFGYNRHGIIVALKGYFDGSGSTGEPLLTVAGYFSSDTVFAEIEHQWNHVLVTNDIKDAQGRPGVFHLATFGTKFCPYKTAGWSIPRRQEFLRKLGGIANHSGVWLIGFSVEISAYENFRTRAAYSDALGPAYSACAVYCLSLAEHLLDLEGRHLEDVAFTFELGDRKHEVLFAFEDYVKGHRDISEHRSIHFLPKATALLQPTDLLAGKLQETLARARRSLGSLNDSRLGLRHIREFVQYYAHDGTTHAILERPKGCFCYFAGTDFQHDADSTIARALESNQQSVRRLRKARDNQGKRQKRRVQ